MLDKSELCLHPPAVYICKHRFDYTPYDSYNIIHSIIRYNSLSTDVWFYEKNNTYDIAFLYPRTDLLGYLEDLSIHIIAMITMTTIRPLIDLA